MSVIGLNFVTLRLHTHSFPVDCRHTKERQTLGYLVLKIWTIFKSIQIAGNDAHADVYIAASRGLTYISKAWAFTCYLWKAVQSLRAVTMWKFTLLYEEKYNKPAITDENCSNINHYLLSGRHERLGTDLYPEGQVGRLR